MYNIDKSAHYFVLMHPLESVLGLMFYTSSNTREKWVECEVVEERYKVEDEYKVELRSIEQLVRAADRTTDEFEPATDQEIMSFLFS